MTKEKLIKIVKIFPLIGLSVILFLGAIILILTFLNDDAKYLTIGKIIFCLFIISIISVQITNLFVSISILCQNWDNEKIEEMKIFWMILSMTFLGVVGLIGFYLNYKKINSKIIIEEEIEVQTI